MGLEQCSSEKGAQGHPYAFCASLGTIKGKYHPYVRNTPPTYNFEHPNNTSAIGSNLGGETLTDAKTFFQG